MANGISLQFFSEAEGPKIPTAPGLYAFYLRPLTPSALGLLNAAEPSPASAALVRGRIAKIATRFISFVRSGQLQGRVVESSRASHIAMRMSVVAEQTPDLGRIMELSEHLPNSDLRDVLSMLGKISLFAQPIYVGITYDNTLAARYQQHRQDHFAEPPNLGTFGGRLRSSGYEWRQIVFGCMPTSELSVSAGSLDFLEKYFQALSSPVLSIR